MNRLLAFLASVILLLALALGFAVFWNAPTLQTARGEAIRLQGVAEAQALQAQTANFVAQSAVANSTEARAQPAAVLGRQIFYVGAGIATAVLLMGLALAVVAWASLRAVTVFPNHAGQFPLVRVGGFGWSGFIDPNRAPGPLTIFKTLTLFDIASDMTARLHGRESKPTLEVQTPHSLSEAAILQLTGQAAAVAMAASASRWPDSARATNIRRAAENVMTKASALALPMPEVERVEPSHVERLLELTEGETLPG